MSSKIRPLHLLKQTASDWMDDNALRLSAALAYYSIFSIAPLLVIAISIAGWVFGAEAATGQVHEQLKGYLGAQAAEAVQSMVKSAAKPSSSILGAILGFATLLLGASGIFGQLKDALNTVWEVKQKEGGGVMKFIRERVLSFGMVLVIGFLLLTSLLMTTALAACSSYLEKSFGLPSAIWGVFAFLISFIVVALLFGFIFKVLPDAKIPWRSVWIGAGLTALLFEVGKFGLSMYLGRESTASAYGAAGSVILVLLWVYYASCILLFGAEFCQVYATETGHVIEPSKNAELATAADRQADGVEVKSETKGAQQDPPEPPESIHVRHSEAEVASPVIALLAVTTATCALGLLGQSRKNGAKH